MLLSKKYHCCIVGIFTFLIYVTTLAPSVIEGDSGELATVQFTLGIPHPTGYPLFTIVGYLFSLLPLPFRAIFKLNLLCSIYVSLAIVTFTFLIKLLLENLNSFIGKNAQELRDFNITDNIKYILTAFGGLFLGFSFTVWLQSTSVEVYSLNLFLILLMFLFFFKAYLSPSSTKYWITFSVILAFGFITHQTFLFMIPGLAYLYFEKFGFKAETLKRITMILLIFIPIVVFFYILMMIRAAQQPILNWGDVSSLTNLWNHISGQIYHRFLSTSTEITLKQFSHFLNGIILHFNQTQISGSEFNIGIFLALFGMISSFFSYRKLFYFLLINLITSVTLPTLYRIPDIDAYFLPSYLTISLFTVLGAVSLFNFSNNKIFHLIIVMLLVSILVVEFSFNYRRVDKSDNYFLDDYTKNLIESVQPNSIIISNRSHFYFPWYYLRYIENLRTDVVVVDNLLLEHSWYLKQLKKNHPNLVSQDENNYNLNLKDRQLYLSPELSESIENGKFKLQEGKKIIPDLFLYRVVDTDEYYPIKMVDFKIRVPRIITPAINEARQNIYLVLISRIGYEIQHGKIENAKLLIRKIKTDFKDFNSSFNFKKLQTILN